MYLLEGLIRFPARIGCGQAVTVKVKALERYYIRTLFYYSDSSSDDSGVSS
jgi:hypothetical protein